MYEVEVLNIKYDKVFKKEFWCYESFKEFVRKVRYSKNLILLSAINNSLFYD